MMFMMFWFFFASSSISPPPPRNPLGPPPTPGTPPDPTVQDLEPSCRATPHPGRECIRPGCSTLGRWVWESGKTRADSNLSGRHQNEVSVGKSTKKKKKSQVIHDIPASEKEEKEEEQLRCPEESSSCW